MIGAVGAMACVLACTFAGFLAKDRCNARLASLEGWSEALDVLRLLLEEERLPIDELLRETADGIADCDASRALRTVADRLARSPRLTVGEAFAGVKPAHAPAELSALFRQLGTGTVAMRAQAAEQARRRLERAAEQARKAAAVNGALYAKLGLLGGLTLGVALW